MGALLNLLSAPISMSDEMEVMSRELKHTKKAMRNLERKPKESKSENEMEQ